MRARPGLELATCHFYRILVVKASHEASQEDSPDPRDGEILSVDG